LLGEDPGDPQNGYFVSPTIFAVEPDATVAREEIFGPVLSVLKARDFDEALKLANDSPYGLTGGVYSKTAITSSEPAKSSRRATSTSTAASPAPSSASSPSAASA
jgi:acyl-CoA reductase-like NAD-dependent aldehyde dehydrogenase